MSVVDKLATRGENVPETLNPEIIGRLIGSPGGIYGEDLAAIAPDYHEQIAALVELGAEFEYAEDPAGKKYCKLKNPETVRQILEQRSGQEPGDPPHHPGDDAEPQTPAPPPSSSPPAETPPAEITVEDVERAAKELTEASKDARRIFYLEARSSIIAFTARSIAVDQRKITLRPDSKTDAAEALSFAMDVEPGMKIRVYMEIEQEPPTEGEKQEKGGDKVPKDPKDLKTVQTISKPPNEKDPAKKSKQQLERELSEQVNKGEVSTTLADATARMAGL